MASWQIVELSIHTFINILQFQFHACHSLVLMEENYNIHNSLVKCINEWLQSPARRHLIFSVNSICMRPIAACTSCKLQAVRGSPLHLKRPTREPMHSRFFRDWLDYRTQTLAYCEITCRRHFAHHSEDISCGAKASHMFSAWFFLSLSFRINPTNVIMAEPGRGLVWI